MKKTALTLLLLLTALILSACSAEAQMLRAQPIEQVQVQRATLAVLPDEQVYRAWMWATQTAEGRVAETAQARSTETARAWAATDAVGTSTARAIASAWAIAEARETDAVAATREAGAQTAVVQQAQVQATIAVYQIRVEQARRTAEFGAWWEYAAAPFWALLLSLLAILAWAVYSWPRVIRADANGLPIIAMGGHVIQPPPTERRQEYQPEPSTALAISAPAIITNNLPPVAPWDVITAEWRGGDLPLGVGSDGALIMTPFDADPHLLYGGTTGSGKSRRGLRALVACALSTDRWRVTLVDKSGVDYPPHINTSQNCHYLNVDHKQPQKAAEILRRVYDEIDRRQDVLASSGFSTWERYNNGPMDMVVVDEFGILADLCKASEKEELWRWTRMVAAEGRKTGIMLVIALQDVTEKSIDLRIRRLSRSVAYRVKERKTSQLFLGSGGAECLRTGQFLTNFGSTLVQGVGFDPTDNQIVDLIQAANVPDLGAPEWIAEPEAATNDYNGEDKRARVIELLGDGRSQGEVEQEVYGYRGGRAYQAVAKIAREWRAGSTTTRL